LLSEAEVRRVVDVQTIPRSRTNPHDNPEALAEAFSESRIDYEHTAALGGLRSRSLAGRRMKAICASLNFDLFMILPPRPTARITHAAKLEFSSKDGSENREAGHTLRNSRGFAAWLGEIGSRLSTQRVTSW
jgi:Domain of unknown function DUF488